VVLDQGLTISGQITIYGAAIGNTVRAVSFEGNLSAQMEVTTASQYTLTLKRNAAGSVQTAAGASINPYVSLVPGGDGSSLIMIMRGVNSDARLNVLVVPPDNRPAKSVELGYSPVDRGYTGTVGFNTSAVGLGSVHVLGLDPSAQLVVVDSDFSLLKVETTATQDLFSPDGHVRLHLEPNTLPGTNAFVVLMPTGAVPQPLPPKMGFVGSAYSLRASGGVMTTQRPALLEIFYGAEQLGGCRASTTLQIGFWDGNRWNLQPGQLNETHQTLSRSINELGVYGLLCGSNQHHVHLPLISK
jgi:hypothetical protein